MTLSVLLSQLENMLDDDTTLAAVLKGVTTHSLTQSDDNDYVVVTFNINLDETNSITDAYILSVFNQGLTGSSDTIPPQNKIVAGSAEIGEAGRCRVVISFVFTMKTSQPVTHKGIMLNIMTCVNVLNFFIMT